MEDKIYAIFRKYPRLIMIGLCLIVVLILIIIIEVITPQVNYIANIGDQEPATQNISAITDKENTKIYAEIAGQVNNPGVYVLDQEILAIELIDLAGGLTLEADLDYVHQNIELARYVIDGEKIYIPTYLINEQQTVANKITTNTSNTLVRINTASQKELESLAGIGEITAQKIIANRPYSQIEELKTRAIISESVYNKIVTQIEL